MSILFFVLGTTTATIFYILFPTFLSNGYNCYTTNIKPFINKSLNYHPMCPYLQRGDKEKEE